MAKNNEAKIKFTAETGEFNDQIKSADSTLKELRSELKLNSTEMKGMSDSTEKLQERQKILARELEASQQKTKALSDKLDKAKEIFGENSDEAKKLQTQLNNAKTAEQNIANEIATTNKKLDEQKLSLKDVADAAEKTGDKLTSAGKKMSTLSAGIVAAGTASIAAFNAVDEGADNAIKATGATGEAAVALEESYKNVAASITGDFGDIGSALGEVNTRFGFTDKELETATQKFLEFSQVTGMDATTAVQKVSRYMGDAGIDSSKYASVLDNLTVAAQASGISMDTLAENLTKYGAPMRALGFETEESIAIFSSWEKAGVNTEIAFSGMKKAIGEWSKEGKDSRVEFKKTLDEIASCPDIASATTKAIEVFGQKAGPDLADAIKGGRFEYEDMLKVIEGSQGALESTFDGTIDGGYEMELAMQNAKVALAEVGNTLATTLAPIVTAASEKLKGFANWWKGLDENAQKTIITIAGVVAAIGPVLIVLGTLASSISKITTLINAMKVAHAAATVAQTGLNTSMLACPITWIIAGIVALVAIIVVLAKNWDKVKAAGANAWKGIQKAWANAGAWFSGKWKSIQASFKNVGSWFSNKFAAARDGIMSAWSKLKLKMPKIKLPHFKLTGSFSLKNMTVPKLSVQWYAKGGIFTKPTIFSTPYGFKGVGDVRGGEAVLPLDRLQGFVSTAVERSMPGIDLTPLVDAIEDLARRPVALDINGRRVAEATAGDTDAVNGARAKLAKRGIALK